MAGSGFTLSKQVMTDVLPPTTVKAVRINAYVAC